MADANLEGKDKDEETESNEDQEKTEVSGRRSERKRRHRESYSPELQAIDVAKKTKIGVISKTKFNRPYDIINGMYIHIFINT